MAGTYPVSPGTLSAWCNFHLYLCSLENGWTSFPVMNGSLHLSSVSMAPVPRLHWGWSVYFIALKTCLCIKDPYVLSEISYVHLPRLSYITALCLWHFAVQRWFCLLCTQGNPAHYSQTHRISSILLVRLLFLFFRVGIYPHRRCEKWIQLSMWSLSASSPVAQLMKETRLDPWVRTIPWKRRRQPTPYFFLENPVDRGVWEATVHRVTRGSDDWATEHTAPTWSLGAVHKVHLSSDVGAGVLTVASVFTLGCVCFWVSYLPPLAYLLLHWHVTLVLQSLFNIWQTSPPSTVPLH